MVLRARSANAKAGTGARTRLLIAAFVLAFTGAPIVALAAKTARTAQTTTPRPGQFNVSCKYTHSLEADPIVAPGVAGGSHRHDFLGNPSTDHNSTASTLAATEGTCGPPLPAEDRSAYWAPALKLTDGTWARPTGGTFYFRTAAKEPGSIKPIPMGLRVVAGNPRATDAAPQELDVASWQCYGSTLPRSASPPPSCPAGSTLRATVRFPDCWDEKGDSSDGAGHFAYARRAVPNHVFLSCPSSHPVALPQLRFITRYDVPAGTEVVELSSGGKHSLHADFFNAWDPAVQARLVEQCLNRDVTCDRGTATPAPKPPGGLTNGHEGEFSVSCAYTHSREDDPIVAPGVAGGAHRHDFFGNPSTAHNSTAQSLAATRGTCGPGRPVEDRSAYWAPSVQRADGSWAKPKSGTFYYQRADKAPGSIQPFPFGLRMVAGDARATAAAPQSVSVASWQCYPGQPTSATPAPSCPAGTTLRATVRFPDCWDNAGDSADGPGHFAYARRAARTDAYLSCPVAHPVPLPRLRLVVSYNSVPGVDVVGLSSGGLHSLHADFFNAWDPETQARLVRDCLNADITCPAGTLGPG